MTTIQSGLEIANKRIAAIDTAARINFSINILIFNEILKIGESMAATLTKQEIKDIVIKLWVISRKKGEENIAFGMELNETLDKISKWSSRDD